jgi:hypothetical protein
MASKSRLGVWVEPLEFTSSGGRGESLSRQVKSPFLIFYEGINIDMNGIKKKTEDFNRIGNILCDVLSAFRADADLEMAGLFSLWDGIVGDAVAKNARPAGFKGKILMVNVSSSVWIQELQYYKKDMIKKLNEALGKDLVCDIKFKIGPV